MRPSRYVVCSKCGKSVRTRGWAAHWSRSHPGLVVPGIPPVGASLEAPPSRWTWADFGRPELGPAVHHADDESTCEECLLQEGSALLAEAESAEKDVTIAALLSELSQLREQLKIVHHAGDQTTCHVCQREAVLRSLASEGERQLRAEVARLKALPPVVQHHGLDPTCPTCVSVLQNTLAEARPALLAELKPAVIKSFETQMAAAVDRLGVKKEWDVVYRAWWWDQHKNEPFRIVR